MPAEPLTLAEAVAIAAVPEAHPTRERMCASTGEKASHSGDSSARTGTIEVRNEAVPEVRQHQGDLTASTSTDVSGRHEQL